MGCTASKLDNEDTVRRCKERRGLMKQAVHSRHHLASAHADYLRSLRLTGAALSRFAADEPFTVSEETPPVLLRAASTASTASGYVRVPMPPPPPPPPHPQPIFTPPSPTIASSKLPHILSESSPPATPPQKYPSQKFPYFPSNASTYSTTPSQSSSVWNWENFYPPSPPGSDFYRNKAHSEHTYNEDDEHEQEEAATEQEEVHCSEWFEHGGSHSSSSSSLSDEEHETSHKESPARSEAAPSVATPLNYAPSSSGLERAPSMPNAEEKSFPKGRSEAGSTVDGEISNMRMVVRHRNLAEIVKAIEEHFELAATAGGPVSDLLETGRAQFDRSFRQLKKTVYHSNSVLSNLSSSWTSKPPLAIRYRLDAGTLEDSGGGKSHASTLERLLAWEKKLYEEVKAREGVKIAHEKKLSALQSQEYRGHDEAKLDKTKASIKKLQSLILVTSQAVSATSSETVKLRDNELASQLVELCNQFTHMWRSMNQFHEVQNHIVQQVRGLVNRSMASGSTSEPHRQATRDLEAAVSAWHSSFSRLIKYQRDYVCSLHAWLKLTVHPVSDEKDQSVATNVSSELFTFCDEWKQALGNIPDTVASEAIKSFITVVHSITLKQSEELKIKKRADSASKELEKKADALRNIERKFYQSYSTVGIGLPDSGADNGQVFDARDPLAEKKAEIATCRSKVEDETLRHRKAIDATRALTLNNIQTGLPGVFQAMTAFSGLFAESLEGVCTRAGALR